MKLPILFFAMSSIAACSNGSKEATFATPCKPIGTRLNQLRVEGSIYGSVGTRVHLSVCPNTKMPLAFVGSGDVTYLALKQKASTDLTEVQFTAIGTGYIVNDGGKYTFIAITLENLRAREIPEGAR